MIGFLKWDWLSVYTATPMNTVYAIAGALILCLVGVIAVLMVRHRKPPRCPACLGRKVRQSTDGYSYVCEDCREMFVEGPD
jgi:hypothetical protein